MSRQPSVHVTLTLEQRDEVDNAKSQLRLVPSTLRCISEAAGTQSAGVPDALILIAEFAAGAVQAIDDVFAAADAGRKGGRR